MKDNKTQEIKINNDGLEALTARVSPGNKEFIETYAAKMHRSVAEQMRQLLDKLEAGELSVIEYELRNIGVKVKTRQEAEK